MTKTSPPASSHMYKSIPTCAQSSLQRHFHTKQGNFSLMKQIMRTPWIRPEEPNKQCWILDEPAINRLESEKAEWIPGRGERPICTDPLHPPVYGTRKPLKKLLPWADGVLVRLLTRSCYIQDPHRLDDEFLEDFGQNTMKRDWKSMACHRESPRGHQRFFFSFHYTPVMCRMHANCSGVSLR